MLAAVGARTHEVGILRSLGFSRNAILISFLFEAALIGLAGGAIGAVLILTSGYHAISVARQVMQRTSHVMLVGKGAALFADEIGERKGDILSDQAKAKYQNWLQNLQYHHCKAGPASGY